jgi:hypothetical protein
VVGQLAAAARGDDVDPLRAAPVLAQRQVARLRAAPERVHGLVLEQQQHLAELAVLHTRAQPLLDLQALLVRDAAEVADEQVSHLSDGRQSARPGTLASPRPGVRQT